MARVTSRVPSREPVLLAENLLARKEPLPPGRQRGAWARAANRCTEETWSTGEVAGAFAGCSS
jgi:hypothetical protein